MALELLSENSTISPRISFSHDLSQSDVVPVEQLFVRSNSSSSLDFDFCVFRESFDQESSSADELFSDGKILPIQIKKRVGSAPKRVAEHPLPPLPQPPDDCRKMLKNKSNSKCSSDDSDGTKMPAGTESEEKQNPKSFWRFKRSSSLNCGNGYARTLCPLPLLSRSHSTGSASSSSVKRSSSAKENSNHRQNSAKAQSSIKQSQTPASTTTTHYHQKPPLKKSYGSYGNGVRIINPVLNVTAANFFGLGTIFSGSKDKNKKK